MEKYLIAEYETYAREPVLRRMPDGTLVCMSLTGGKTEPENVNYVAIVTSSDNGLTWTKPKPLFYHSKRGVWCTEIFCGGENPIAAVHTYNADVHYRELQTFYSETKDSGKTWSEPKSFSGAINGCSLRQGIVLSNGDFLIPLYWQEILNGFGGKAEIIFRSGAGISSDGGKTWQRCGYLSGKNTLWEPNAVEVENGHIIMYCRSYIGCLYISESFDYGRTWSKPVMSDIPNSDTKVTLLKVRDTILMINNFTKEKRNHLGIYKSIDGKNFEKVTDVDNEEELFYYPHAFGDDNEQILYVAYENAKQHYLAKFTYDELGI